MTTLQVLRKARALIKKGWTQRVFARDASGESIAWASPAACKWCVDGALMAAGGRDRAAYMSAYWKFSAAVDGHYASNPISFNDAIGRTKRQVLAAFDRAIKACK